MGFGAASVPNWSSTFRKDVFLIFSTFEGETTTACGNSGHQFSGDAGHFPAERRSELQLQFYHHYIKNIAQIDWFKYELVSEKGIFMDIYCSNLYNGITGEVEATQPCILKETVNAKITYCQLLTNTSMEHWWDDTDRAKPKYLDKFMSYCHFTHHSSHTDWPGMKLRLLRGCNSLCHVTARLSRIQKTPGVLKELLMVFGLQMLLRLKYTSLDDNIMQHSTPTKIGYTHLAVKHTSYLVTIFETVHWHSSLCSDYSCRTLKVDWRTCTSCGESKLLSRYCRTCNGCRLRKR